MVVIFRTIWTFNKFEEIYLLTRGGPGTSTFNLAIYSFEQSVASLKMGVGAATGVVMMLLLFVGSLMYMRVFRFATRRPAMIRRLAQWCGRSRVLRAAHGHVPDLLPAHLGVLDVLKAPKDVMATPPRLLADEVTAENYRNLITGKEQYFRADQAYVPTTAAPQHFISWFANSVIVSGSAARDQHPHQHARRLQRHAIPLLGPADHSVLQPARLHDAVDHPRLPAVPRDGRSSRLTNSLWSLTFGYVSITLPFCMWLLWAFFRGIPIELEEAAMIDGASRLRVFVDIVLPSALPGIIAAAIFSLIVSWNDFLFARVFINSIENLPLTVGVMHFFEGVHVDWGLMMASAVLMTVPMAVLFMLMQRHLVAGFGAGAVKG